MRARALRKMRDELLEAARSGATMTYGELMKRHSLSRGRSLSAAIGGVDRLEYAHGAPGFAAIVVRKDTGFPGGGYFCDNDLPKGLRREPWRGADPRLSTLEKSHVKEQQRRIWAYYGKKSKRLEID